MSSGEQTGRHNEGHWALISSGVWQCVFWRSQGVANLVGAGYRKHLVCCILTLREVVHEATSKDPFANISFSLDVVCSVLFSVTQVLIEMEHSCANYGRIMNVLCTILGSHSGGNEEFHLLEYNAV
jgi:hypothetical protein